MSPMNVNQRVKRIVRLTDAECQELNTIGCIDEEDLQYLTFADLPSAIPLVKRRKLETVIKYLTRGLILNDTILMNEIQARVNRPMEQQPIEKPTPVEQQHHRQQQQQQDDLMQQLHELIQRDEPNYNVEEHRRIFNETLLNELHTTPSFDMTEEKKKSIIHILQNWDSGTEEEKKKLRQENHQGYNYRKKYEIKNNMHGYELYRKDKNGGSRLVVHTFEVFDAIYDAHRSLGHLGRDATWTETKKRYYNISQSQVGTYIELCPVCQQNGKRKRKYVQAEEL